MVWRINTTCDSVYIWSILFETEEYYDKVLIDHKMYSGDLSINDVLPPNFEVYFTSDESVTDNGFVLKWNCDGSPKKGLNDTYNELQMLKSDNYHTSTYCEKRF